MSDSAERASGILALSTSTMISPKSEFGIISAGPFSSVSYSSNSRSSLAVTKNMWVWPRNELVFDQAGSERISSIGESDSSPNCFERGLSW